MPLTMPQNLQLIPTNNVVGGNGAAVSLNTGVDNVFLGTSAGAADTTGSRNIFLGTNSGSGETTLNDHVIIGDNAGLSLASGNGSVIIGAQAGQSTPGSAVGIIAIGYQAGKVCGAQGVCIGYQAGLANSGTGNTFIGDSAAALSGGTSGSSNTGIGTLVFSKLTTSPSNTAVGHGASQNLASGIGGNVTVGQNSGKNLTSGYGNVFVGASAGFGSAVYSCTFIGKNSGGGTNPTGVENTAVGASTLQNPTGARNCAFGVEAMISITSGADNVGIGYRSLNSIGANGTNTAIGNYSGQSSTGAGCVFLGYTAGQNNVTNNALYIANSNAAFPLIYGEFDNGLVAFNGNVCIGLQTPEAWGAAYTALQVGGIGNWSGYTSAVAGGDLTLSLNAYFDTGWKYQITDEAASYQMINGTHVFNVAASGTADAAISFTTAMSIANNGAATFINQVECQDLRQTAGTNSYYTCATAGAHIFRDNVASVAAHFDYTVVAGNTRLLIYDVDNAALERVTVGAADSGGAGFKVLRIPN